jgi:hypothetical protein
MNELPPLRTPLTYPAIANGLLVAFSALDNMLVVNRRMVRVASCQIAIETGLSSCMNWNLSGMKTSPNNKGGYDWQYFKTRERFTDAQLAAAKQLGPVEDSGTIEAGLHSIYLLPKHPWCCFRAFESLDVAMLDHLATLRRKFPRGWAGLITGDVEAFAHGLKQDGYYTATEASYAGGIAWRYAQEFKAVPEDDPVWGDVT